MKKILIWFLLVIYLLVDTQKSNIRVLFTEIWAVGCHAVLTICISSNFEEHTRLKTESVIYTWIYISMDKPQRILRWKSSLSTWWKIGMHVLFKFLELETVNGPNFQWLLLNFGTTNPIYKAHIFRATGAFVLFWRSKIFIMKIIFAWTIGIVVVQWLFMEKYTLDQYFTSAN